MPPGDGRVASPSGGCATRPRASIGWMDDVGADRRVGRRAQLRVVVGAVQPEAAGEVDQRLLLRQRPQHRHRRLQRRQLAIGVEDVELGIVLAERGARFGVVRNPVAVHVVAVDQSQNHVPRAARVVGEVVLHADGAASNVMIAIRSAAVHLCSRNFSAAEKARI